MTAKKSKKGKKARKPARKVAKAPARKTRKAAPKKTKKSSVTVSAKKRSKTVKAKKSSRTRVKAKKSSKTAVKAKKSRKTTVKAKKSRKSTVHAHKIHSSKGKTHKKVFKAPATPKSATKELVPVLDLERYEVKKVAEQGVKDTFFGSTRYAWIGSGQCGGRLVKSFYDLGYHKAIAVNTTSHDLDLLEIPASQKFLMDIGKKGAGKDMSRGLKAAGQFRQDILHMARKTFGTEVDHIMVCFGAGGGTGGGSAAELVDMAKDYARSIGKTDPNKAVGVIMTLPTGGEANSPQVARNANRVAVELGEMAARGQISPLIIVDNEKISRMYPGKTVREFWPSINNTIAGMFDIFNRLSSLNSPYTTFDPTDYQSIVNAGGCAIMGLTKVDNYKDRFAISSAVKQNLEKTLLSNGFDLSTAKVAGCAFVGGKRLMANTPNLQDNINYAFDVLADITGNATVHRGIYEDGRETLRVYTIIGGLEFPSSRVDELTADQLVTV